MDGSSPIVRDPREKPLDPDLAAKLRELADARIKQQIAAAKQRATQRREDRLQFTERRRIGLRARHATKAARQNLTQLHQQKGTQP